MRFGKMNENLNAMFGGFERDGFGRGRSGSDNFAKAGFGFGGGKGFGRGFGVGRDFGGKMKGKLLSSEDMHLLVLHLLNQGPNYGYEIIKSIETLSSGTYAPSPGMIYPLLSYIVEAGHANSTQEGNRKVFEITEDGKAFLETKQKEVEELLEKIKIFGERIADVKSRMEEEDSAEERWGRDNSGEHDFTTRAQFHEIRHELRAALFKKRLASKEEKQRVLDILRRAIAEINNKPNAETKTSNEGEE